MAFVITVAQRKGGAGKTTLAAHLSAALAGRGFAVAAIDLDEQQSFTAWARRRLRQAGAAPVALDEEMRFSLGYRLAKLQDRADVVIIDTPPSAGRYVAGAMRAADLILAPMQLSPRARIADLIREKMVESRLPLARAEIGGRAVFAESLAAGLTAGETDPSGPGAREIDRLTDHVADLAGPRLQARRA